MIDPKFRNFLGITLVIIAFVISAFSPLLFNNSAQTSDHSVVHDYLPRVPAHSGAMPFQVSPTALYSNEPAPMGISDFGYSTVGGAYKYNTTSFLGTFQLNSLSTYNSSTGNTGSSVQLNLMLNFSFSGQSYTYWVQKVAALSPGSSASGEYVTFIDNVWNFSSSSSSQVYSSTLSGNGTVQSVNNNGQIQSLYYSYASSTLPGNNVSLNTPVRIQMKEVSTLAPGGTPEAVMMYNDGYGWVTYDNIMFKFAKGTSSDSGFVVSGYSYNKLGTYYDAELIVGGPGGGSSTQFQSGSFNMSLQYWNGHNYQFIPNAWNFGSDTAETLSNALSVYLYSVSNTLLGSSFSTGSGTLGELYFSSLLGNMNVSIPFSSGVAYINNAQYNFSNYALNLTLYPGLYNLSIIPNGGSKPLQGSFYIAAGEALQLNQTSFEQKYSVNVTETGLAAGTSWTISFSNGTEFNSTSSQIVVYLTNGTYTILPVAPPGYAYGGAPINVTVHGSNQTVIANFSKLYQLYFRESGLNGIEWFVNLSGNIGYNLGSTIVFNVTNGSYNYDIQSINGYFSTPSSGTVTINGSSHNVNITFSPILYEVVLKEKGLPKSYNWSVFVDGAWHNSSNGTVDLYLPNGSYAFTAQSQNGAYSDSANNSTIVVNGSNETVQFSFVNVYNKGLNLQYKFIYLVFLGSVSVAGSLALRRR